MIFQNETPRFGATVFFSFLIIIYLFVRNVCISKITIAYNTGGVVFEQLHNNIMLQVEVV
jgi:hypothetical protein